ncbi:hypothetical protein F5Y19DRAFT_220079 [Xylariaceae sp. FL1651]|nr:hypothetical protein F5Y19DRAFT_220079 [Xylariaceae sp. FL1651]
MALRTAHGSASPDVAHFRETANLQLGSTFFGRLPLEIREMIYAECWVASGSQQHVFLSRQDGRLTHSPCVLTPGEADERNSEIQRLMSRQGQNRRGLQSRSSLVVDEQWASRFSSPWYEHWRCEEEMLRFEKGARDHQSHPYYQTLFLPILLACKRIYIEAFPSLYASITLVLTDLESAHRCLVPSRLHAPTTLLRSLVFSLALPYDALHKQRSSLPPSQCSSPWAQLCTTLSDMARFASLQFVTIRLDLAGDDDADVGDWRRVRERWALCGIRGVLARHLTVQLPAVAHPEWSYPYQYVDGDKTPFRLQRYPKMRWVSVGDGRRIEPLVDLPSQGSIESRLAESGKSRLQKATRGLKELFAGMIHD